MIDLHAHILPGLDDGPRTMDDALALCRTLAVQGVTDVVATPHMFDGVYEVPPEAMVEGVAGLRQALAAAEIPLRVAPGAEVHVDDRAMELARAGRLPTLADTGAYVLLELPDELLPPRLDWCFFEMLTKGLTPILGHPERNAQIQADLGTLRLLVEQGVVVQLVASSLTGEFGERTRKTARRMLRDGLVHLLASDCHHATRRPPRLRQALAEAADLVGEDGARALVTTQAAVILAGEPLEMSEGFAGA